MKGVLLELKHGASFLKVEEECLGCPDKQGAATAKVTGKNEPGLSDV